MAIAGIGWGIYSLRGRGASDPVAANAAAFQIATPLALLASLIAIARFHVSAPGFGWAALSGCVTTGLGYILWYAALPGLGPSRAAIVQLSVPVIAAAGGIAVIGEPLTARLILAAVVTLSGVGVAILGRMPS